MLKSTHRSGGLQPSTSLPEGWTEHTAPSGLKYYYNKETKSSTYTRPTIETTTSAQDEEPLFAEEAGPDPVMQATLRAQEDFARNSAQQGQSGHFTGGRSYQQRPRRGHGGDRPKKKAAIPDCAPWVLVNTKLGRRFVHNTETKESLWKFPQDVMMAVIAMDKIEWDKKQAEKNSKVDESRSGVNGVHSTAVKKATAAQEDAKPAEQEHDYDSSEYEEVEVTDDEGEADPNHGSATAKRPRLSPSQPDGDPPPPAELTEDDIAFQLAAMEADEEDDYYDEDPEADEDEDGLPLTESDSLALFRSLLDSTSTSPYTEFASLLNLAHVVEDPRWLSLPNMSARRSAFATWSRDRVAELSALKEAEQQAIADADPADSDPRVVYMAFLADKASTKLFWPEFKRKFKREEVMRAYEPSEKEREKLYREFVGKLKVSAGQRRKELVELLKGVEKERDRRGVPLKVKRDVRYWVVGEKEREEVVGAWLG